MKTARILLLHWICMLGLVLTDTSDASQPIVGEWVVSGRGKGSAPWLFRADGTYAWYDHRGTWKLEGSEVILTEPYLGKFIETYRLRVLAKGKQLSGEPPGEVLLHLTPATPTSTASPTTAAKMQRMQGKQGEAQETELMKRQQNELREQQERERREQEARALDERINGMSQETFLKRARELESGVPPVRRSTPAASTEQKRATFKEVGPIVRDRDAALKRLLDWDAHMQRQDPNRTELINIKVSPVRVGKETRWSASGEYQTAPPKPQSVSRQ
jgi:hypothetical protein